MDREAIWLEKRAGKITSSGLGKLMTGSRGSSGGPYGQTAINYIAEIAWERRTGCPVRSQNIRNFAYGNYNEPLALECLKAMGYNVKSCSEDFDEIIFKEIDSVPMFGDSPDFYEYRDGKVYAVGEIKSLVSQGKFEMYRKMCKSALISEYIDQFTGHLIAHPDVDRVCYVIYDGIDDDNDNDYRDALDTSRIRVIYYHRDEIGNYLNEVVERINKTNRFLELYSKDDDVVITDINNINV